MARLDATGADIASCAWEVRREQRRGSSWWARFLSFFLFFSSDTGLYLSATERARNKREPESIGGIPLRSAKLPGAATHLMPSLRNEQQVKVTRN